MATLSARPPVRLLIAPARLWISLTLARFRAELHPVAKLEFARLPRFFSPGLLAYARVAAVDRMPLAPPLRLWSSMDSMENISGLTLRNAYFLRRDEMYREDLHAHELVHILQWRLLGESKFLRLWLSDEQTRGYGRNRLEKIAYRVQEEFKKAKEPFDAEARVAELVAGLGT